MLDIRLYVVADMARGEEYCPIPSDALTRNLGRHHAWFLGLLNTFLARGSLRVRPLLLYAYTCKCSSRTQHPCADGAAAANLLSELTVCTLCEDGLRGLSKCSERQWGITCFS